MLIHQEDVDRLDELANLAYFRGYGFYEDAATRAVVEYFAPALAYAGWPEIDSPEMHSFFTQYLTELLNAARLSGLHAAGAHLASVESPRCSAAPAIADLRKQIHDAAAEFIVPRYNEIEWPVGPCFPRDAFNPEM